MKSYTRRPDIFTLNFTLTLSGPLRALQYDGRSAPAHEHLRSGTERSQDVASEAARGAVGMCRGDLPVTRDKIIQEEVDVHIR